MKRSKDDVILKLHLPPDQTKVVGILSRMSGESPHAVLRVLLAVGTLTVAPLRKKTRR